MKASGRQVMRRALGILALGIYALPALGTAALIAAQHRSFAEPVVADCCSEPSSPDQDHPVPVHDPDHCLVCLQLLVWWAATPLDTGPPSLVLARSSVQAEVAPAAPVVTCDFIPWSSPRAPPPA
jgi:hypothetical protein